MGALFLDKGLPEVSQELRTGGGGTGQRTCQAVSLGFVRH